jgi:hypothetical protein
MLQKIFSKLEKWFDYHVVYFLYNGRKQNQYIRYMRSKYSDSDF